MDKREEVSSIQMAMLFLAYLTGSAIVNIPAPLTGAARNGAWLSLLLAGAIGMLLLACVLFLGRQYRGLSFIEYSRITVGNRLTVIIAIPFLAAMLIQLPAIVIDISGFFNSTMLRKTPSFVIQFLFILVSALTSLAGIEVMARMFVTLILTMFGFIIAIWVLVLPYYHPEYLLPVAPDGIKPILHGAYIVYGFPYAELILFAMMLPFVRKKDEATIGKYMVYTLIINCVTLLISIESSVMVVGPLSGNIKYSLYQLARLILIQEIVERIESVIGFSLIAGSYMKTAITLFILTKFLSQLFKVQNDRLLTFPVAFVCLLLSATMYKNEMDFVEFVNVTWPLFVTVGYVFPLFLIAALTILKRKKMGSN